MMKKLDNTQYFKIQSDQEIRVSEVLQLVYQASGPVVHNS